jgi:hypothetical protein
MLRAQSINATSSLEQRIQAQHSIVLNNMRQFLIFVFVAFATPAFADGYVRVTERGAFVSLVKGKSLTTLGVSLTVSPSGGIGGSAFGRTVTGTWTWSNGFFCRTMKAGDRAFPRNCQLVQQNGKRIRFIADQGAGDTADLRIR